MVSPRVGIQAAYSPRGGMNAIGRMPAVRNTQQNFRSRLRDSQAIANSAASRARALLLLNQSTE